MPTDGNVLASMRRQGIGFRFGRPACLPACLDGWLAGRRHVSKIACAKTSPSPPPRLSLSLMRALAPTLCVCVSVS